MPGPEIIFRAIDLGYAEPTVIYQCIKGKNGKWELREEYEIKGGTLDHIADVLKNNTIAPHKPVVIPDDMPREKHELKARGIRVL